MIECPDETSFYPANESDQSINIPAHINVELRRQERKGKALILYSYIIHPSSPAMSSRASKQARSQLNDIWLDSLLFQLSFVWLVSMVPLFRKNQPVSYFSSVAFFIFWYTVALGVFFFIGSRKCCLYPSSNSPLFLRVALFLSFRCILLFFRLFKLAPFSSLTSPKSTAAFYSSYISNDILQISLPKYCYAFSVFLTQIPFIAALPSVSPYSALP